MAAGSIHPRGEGGTKSNTCSPRSARNGGAGSKTLRRVSKRLAIRRADHERMTDKNGYRKPGSMKP